MSASVPRKSPINATMIWSGRSWASAYWRIRSEDVVHAPVPEVDKGMIGRAGEDDDEGKGHLVYVEREREREQERKAYEVLCL